MIIFKLNFLPSVILLIKNKDFGTIVKLKWIYIFTIKAVPQTFLVPIFTHELFTETIYARVTFLQNSALVS